MQRSCWWSQSPLRRARCHKWPSRWKFMINTDSEVALENGLRLSKRISTYTLQQINLEPGCSAFGLWFYSQWDQALMFGWRGWAHIQLYSSGFDGSGPQALCRSVMCFQNKLKVELCLASCMLHADTTCKQLPQISKRFNEPTDWRLCFVDSIKKH